MRFALFMCLAAMLVFSACVPPVQQPVQQDSACEVPYASVNGACCLDKNANRVCDRDETQRSETVVRERPVILVQEVCNLPRFTCLQKEITPDFVSLKLRFERDEVLKVEKMTLKEIGCSQSFEKVELRFNDEYEFKIPCLVEGDAVKAEVSTEVEITPILKYSSGQVFGYGTPAPAVLKGEISGLVKG